jgi:hypothetical protein
MSTENQQAWWDSIPSHVGGDAVIATVGSGASNVAIGKNITQTIYDALGEPTPDDKDTIRKKFAEVSSALQNAQDQIDTNTAQMAEFQLKLLEGELAKTEEDQTPSASTITQVGDWLLDNVPAIAEVVTGLFATPAVGRVVGKAGEVAVQWLKNRFKRAA